MSAVPVVIVGAGPAGLTAATLLGQYGVECLVLERWGSVYPQPRAVASPGSAAMSALNRSASPVFIASTTSLGPAMQHPFFPMASVT